MITEKELNLINLSATKKDFYQIWNELLEVASKISERWDPLSTNETDPGIVLLKVLTATADKLNYNIDKNILEAFMPTAAQEESMRKLCDMMGYTMKYYQSATTNITFYYSGNTKSAETALPASGLTIPIFTPITNADKDISYITTSQGTLLNDQTTIEIPCIEGQLAKCESDTDNIISLIHLDESNRYYLPETQIAENGLFVYNISDNIKSDAWTRIDNLNTQPAHSKVYKFGFDSQEYRPYIQFPDDIGNLIEDGLEIYYIRTSGAQGNVSAKTLTVFEKPNLDEWADYADNDSFIVTNYSAATNGKNPETINQAYSAFKKTIGTFDTLVTCRDYMNKIYSLVSSQNVPLVSNIMVSDIRDDINRAQTICSFNDFGLCYVDKSNKVTIEKDKKSVSVDAIEPFDLVLYPFRTYNNLGTITDYKNSFTYNDSNNTLIETLLKDSKTIAHNFKYPSNDEIVCIKNYLRLNAKISTTTKVGALEELAIIANIKAALFNTFNMRELEFGQEIPFDIILECIENADNRIKNVSLEEPALYTKFLCQDGSEYDCITTEDDTDDKNSEDIKQKIIKANKLYNKLALRNILAGKVKLFNYDDSFAYDFTETDYGEVTAYKPEDAESDEPYTEIETTLADLTSRNEEQVEIPNVSAESSKTLSYNSTYGYIYADANDINKIQYASQYPIKEGTAEQSIIINKLESELPLDISKKSLSNGGIKLNKHEVIKFRAPNFITTVTYPAYVNYYLKLDNKSKNQDAIPATFCALGEFLNSEVNSWVLEKFTAENEKGEFKDIVKGIQGSNKPTPITYWELFIAYIATTSSYLSSLIVETETIKSVDTARYYTNTYGAIFSKASDKSQVYWQVRNFSVDEKDNSFNGKYYYVDFSSKVFSILTQFISKIPYPVWDSAEQANEAELAKEQKKDPSNLPSWYYLKGLYRKVADPGSYRPGAYVDIAQIKYGECSMWRAFEDPFFDGFYVQQTHKYDSLPQPENKGDYFTTDGLGRGAITSGIPANCEYQLQANEYLCINYTPSASSDNTNSEVEPVSQVFGHGTIIRPNFQMVDSEFRYSVLGKAFAKRDGFDFSRVNTGESFTNPSGLYSLGANEQIELRSLVEVNLEKTVVNLYWVLNNEDNSLTEDTTGATINVIDNKLHYTLGEGEYIYYTNERKQDLAYYGEGTEVILSENLSLVPINEILLTEAEADALGIAGIPWYTRDLTGDNRITLREYQYITLTEGDTLISLTAAEGQTTLGNDWISCKTDSEFPVKYSIGDTVYTLPALAVKGMSWEARSLLEFEVGPNTAQTLYRKGAAITAYAISIDDQNNVKTKIVKITPGQDAEKSLKPISFKTNKEIVISSDNVFLQPDQLDNQSLQIKIFANTAIKIKTGDDNVLSTALALHNIEGKYTKISAANFKTTDLTMPKSLVLPVTVPDGDYALMTIYYKPAEEYAKSSYDAGLTITDTKGKELKGVIFNLSTGQDNKLMPDNWSWWPGREVLKTVLELIPTDKLEVKESDEKDSKSTYWALLDTKYTRLKIAAPALGSINFVLTSGEITTDASKNILDGIILSEFNSLADVSVESPDKEYKLTEISISKKVVTKNNEIVSTQLTLIFKNEDQSKSRTLIITRESNKDTIKENKTIYQYAKSISTKTVYQLQPGLNTLFLKESANISLESDVKGEAVLIFADPSLIRNIDLGIDNRLICYKQTEENTQYYEQILKDIAEIDVDHLFYYDNPVENDTALDLHLARYSLDDSETLEAPRIWYDSNNVNNKFVISEIDADWLDTGIQITKSSKRY